ncbi:MAG: cyclic nucleotide-binding domain-containing protein [Burkholderiales bacterium]
MPPRLHGRRRRITSSTRAPNSSGSRTSSAACAKRLKPPASPDGDHHGHPPPSKMSSPCPAPAGPRLRAPARRRPLAHDARRAARCTYPCPPARAGHELAARRRRLAPARSPAQGEVLVRSGDRFASLYAIRAGSCKSVVTTPSGLQQIAGYHIAGDVLGAEAIYENVYDSTITALEDGEFCVIPFERMETLARQNVDFQRRLSALLSREIARERRVMLILQHDARR